MRDLHSNIGIVAAIAPATYAADVTSAAIDLAGFASAEIAFLVGPGGIAFDATNKLELKIVECDTSGGTYTPVAVDDILGTAVSAGVVKALTSAHAAMEVIRCGYRGYKRFIKVSGDFSGTHGTGTGISAVVVKGTPAVAPVA